MFVRFFFHALYLSAFSANKRSHNQGWQVFARRWKKPVFYMIKTGLAKILFVGKNRFFVGKNRFMPELSSK